MTSAVSDIQPELARDVKLMYSGRWVKKKNNPRKGIHLLFPGVPTASGCTRYKGGLGWIRVVDTSIYVLGSWIPGYLGPHEST